MSMTNFLETELLKAVLNGNTYSGGNITVGLFTTNPGESGGGAEVNDPNYQRQLVTFSAPSQVGGQTTVSNTNLIEFAPAENNFGTVTHIGIFDGANMIFYKALNTPIVANEGTGIRIQPGDLSVSLD